MTVSVRLFARYRELAGTDCVTVEVPSEATLAQVWRAVQAGVPALEAERAPLLALRLTYARPEQAVEAGDEIAAFPPVSGG